MSDSYYQKLIAYSAPSPAMKDACHIGAEADAQIAALEEALSDAELVLSGEMDYEEYAAKYYGEDEE